MAAVLVSSVGLLMIFSESYGLQKVEDHGKPCTYFGKCHGCFLSSYLYNMGKSCDLTAIFEFR